MSNPIAAYEDLLSRVLNRGKPCPALAGSTTLLGHEIVLQDALANVVGAVKWAEDYQGHR